jgi:hypothetical protein
MAAWRRAIELSLEDADWAKLRSIAQSRTEPSSRVERARILLAYRKNLCFFAVGQPLGGATIRRFGAASRGFGLSHIGKASSWVRNSAARTGRSVSFLSCSSNLHSF